MLSDRRGEGPISRCLGWIDQILSGLSGPERGEELLAMQGGRFLVCEIEYFLNHASDRNESIFLIYTYAEFRADSEILRQNRAVQVSDGKCGAEIDRSIPATRDSLS